MASTALDSPQPGIVARNGPPGWSGEAISDLAAFEFHALPWGDLDDEGLERDGITCVKASPSRRVFRLMVPTADGEQAVFAKRYLVKSWWRGIGGLLRGPKARREFHLGLQLRRSNIATPSPLAWAAHARTDRSGAGSLAPASYLLTREWPNVGSIADALRAEPDRAAALMREAAAFLASVHARGFYHDDCSADHLLISAEPRDSPFAFIDVDNGRLLSGPLPERLRIINLFQVLRSIDFKPLDEAGRDAFLAAYLSASSGDAPAEEARSRREAWRRRIERFAARKIDRSVFHASP